MKPMRVGLVTPGWPGGNTSNGIATAVYHLAMGLKMAGHQPVVLTGSTDGEAPNGIPVVQVTRRSWSLAQKLKHRLGASAVTQDVIGDSLADAVEVAKRDHMIDIVLVEETWGWASKIIQKKIVPVVVVLHGPWLIHKSIQGDGSVKLSQERELREAVCMEEAAGIIAPSRNVLDAVQQTLDLDTVPRRVIPNAIAPDERLFSPTALGPILFVGRFDYHKGGDIVLEAFDKLYARHPESRLTFVGPDRGVQQPNGTTIMMSETLAALRNGAEDAINYLGSQPKNKIAALRRTHPIAVIASRYETFGYTMLEAMAAGQAIVSTNVGGMAEVLENGKTALLVPSGRPQAMADALGRLIEETELAARLGSAAKLRLEADFRPQIIAERTIEFLRDIA